MSIFSIIKLVLITLAAVIFVTTSLVLMSDSYAEWQEYYNNAMAEKENQKYLDSLPLTFEGVSASIKDDVVFYANGKATISKNDLEVVAHFSEKGKITDKILSTDEFEMEVPEGFSATGGTIIVKYLYQPEKAEGATEEPAAIVRSTELKVELVPITLTSLNVIVKPYRIYYKESMKFDPSGMELEAVLNSGDTVALDENSVKVVTTEPLTAGMTSAKIAFEGDGVIVEAEIPITVVSAAQYDDSEILEIIPEGSIYLLEGQTPSDAKPTIRATYKNGNRLLLTADQLSIGGNFDKASFLNSCVLNVSLKNNAGVSCQIPAKVRFIAEAESADAVGGSINTIEINGKSVSVMEGFANGNTLTFTINSSTTVKGKLSLSLANNGVTSLRLSDVLSFKINGRAYLVPANTVLTAKNSTRGYDFLDCALPDVVLNEGANVIEISFSNMGGVKLAIDGLNIDTELVDGVGSALTLGEQLVANKDAGKATSALATPATGDDGKISVNVYKEKAQLYSMGGVSDGKYIYISMNAKNNIATVISKIDPSTGSVVAQTTSFVPGAEKIDNSRIFIIDNTLYCIIQDGSMYEIDLDKFNSFDYVATKSSLSFASFGTAFDATWNESTGKIALITKEGTLNILNSDLTEYVANISVSGSNSVASDDKYIYVSYMSGQTTSVDVFTWNGEKIDRISVSGFKLGSETKFNVQAIFMHDGQLHAAVCSWGSTYKEAFFDWIIAPAN